MIEEAKVLGDAPLLRIDAVKALQQRWQGEAQAVPLDRKQEQNCGTLSASRSMMRSTARPPSARRRPPR